MPFKNTIKRIYDEISNDYYQSESHSSGKSVIKDIYRDFLRKSVPLSVLDLGCGSGVFATIAKQAGVKQVVGVDISPSQIGIAKKHAQKLGIQIDYFIGDIAEISFKEHFNALVSSFGFCYAETEEVLGEQIRAAKRHLGSGSMFAVVCDPKHPISINPNSYRVSLESPTLRDGSKLKCDYLHEGEVVASDYKYYWTKETWTRVLTSAGFTDIEWQEVANDSTNAIFIAS